MAFVRAAQLSDVPPGLVRAVRVGEEDIALCNLDGTIYAVANRCSHDDGPLGAGSLKGDEIECPRHGARFCVRNGEVRLLPAIVPLQTYGAEVKGDMILVDVDL